MDLLHLSSLIIVSVLALCVIDVIRRPRLGELVQARYDAEHPHPLARNCARRSAARQCAGIDPRAWRTRNALEGPGCTAHSAPEDALRCSPARGDACPRWHACCTSALAGRPRGQSILMDS